MAVVANAAPALPLPPARASAPTVGALLLARASAAVTNSGASRDRVCSSPRSLLSRILRGGGFGCRLRLPLPRYRSSGAAKRVAAGRAEPPRSSLAGKEALPASLGLGASLVLLLSKSAAELSRMAELRAQMERLMMDVVVGADVRRCNEDGPRTGVPASRGGSEDAGHIDAMDRMEAELEAELSRLQAASNDRQVEVAEAKSGATSGSRSVICSDSDVDDDAEKDQDGDDEDEDEGNASSPRHGGVSARELERRLHELLQARHEARIAELESALERARRKLEEKEREARRWRDTAKLAARSADESRFR